MDAKKKSIQGKAHDGTDGAAGKMNNALLKQANTIRDHLAAAEKGDVLARYNVALDISEVRDTAKFSSGAMNKLAKFLGKGLTFVNDYATLAETWPDPEEFAKLAEKTGANGIPLTWSHFLVLMREQDTDRRAVLMEQALAANWTVEELENGRKKEKAPPGQRGDTEGTKEDDASAGGADEPAPANAITAAVEGIKGDLSAAKVKLQEKLPKVIKDAPDDQLDEALASLHEAREQFVETQESIDLAIAQIEERRKLAAKKKNKSAGKNESAGALVKKKTKKTAA